MGRPAGLWVIVVPGRTAAAGSLRGGLRGDGSLRRRARSTGTCTVAGVGQYERWLSINGEISLAGGVRRPVGTSVASVGSGTRPSHQYPSPNDRLRPPNVMIS